MFHTIKAESFLNGMLHDEVVIPWRGFRCFTLTTVLPHQDGAGKSLSAVARFKAKSVKHFCGDHGDASGVHGFSLR